MKKRVISFMMSAVLTLSGLGCYGLANVHAETDTNVERKLKIFAHYAEAEKQAATCEAAGSVTYQCTNCNDSYTETIEKLEHDYAVTSTIEATCTEAGYTLETCKNCGDTRKINETQTTGHDEGEWNTVQEAKLGEAGSKELRCTRCQALLDTEEIPMLTTDGTDSVYYFENADGGQEMVIGHYNEEEAREMPIAGADILEVVRTGVLVDDKPKSG